MQMTQRPRTKKRINNLKLKSNFLGLTILLLLVLNSCSVEKYIPENERLYTGAKITMKPDSLIRDKGVLEKELNDAVSPEPNTKFLGMRPGLHYYYKKQNDELNFITKWFYKKIGEDPVYQSDVQPLEVEKILINRLENNGYFYSSVDSDFQEKEKEASVVYDLRLTSPYMMKTFHVDSMPSPLYKEVLDITANSPLKKEIRFNLSNMELERKRIDAELKKKGYYNFNPDFLIFEADTNQYDNKRFDLYLTLKNEVPTQGIIPYKISEVNVYPKAVLNDSIHIEKQRFNNKNYIQNPIYFKPKYLDRFMIFEEGQLYDPLSSKNTARRLSSIDIYKYVNIEYKVIDTTAADELGLLQANIYLSALNKRSFRAELQAVTKSNNFTGPNLGLIYTNRNLFFGGEVMDISAHVGYETQFASGDNTGLNSLDYGLTGKLSFPRLISPIKINDDFFEYAVPNTATSIGINFLRRSKLYTLASGNMLFGYNWNANKYVTYELNPIAVNFTRLSNTTQEFEEILDENPFLRRSFEQEFISGLNFSFTYNGILNSKNKNQFYVNTTFDIAGNTVSLVGKDSETNDSKTFLGLEYAQYAKLDIDLRLHHKLGQNDGHKIATRLFAGYGLPYGNSEVLPYVKQYFSGGPYSVRAFRIRSLGPGTYGGESDLDNNDNFFDQTGNIRLEANIEYRFPIISFLKGAVFTDAGNVWNSEPNPIFNGRDEFSSDFINELGIGSGVGLHVDIQGFVIRFDLAAPIHDPTLPEGERWEFQWDDPVLNFAVGYAF